MPSTPSLTDVPPLEVIARCRRQWVHDDRRKVSRCSSATRLGPTHLDPQTMQMRLHNRGISVLGARNSCRTSWPKYLLPLWPTYWATATPAPSTTHNWRLSPGRATSLSGRELVVNERNCLHTNGFQALQDAKPRRTLSTYRLAGGAGFPPWMLSPPTPRPGCGPSHGRPARKS